MEYAASILTGVGTGPSYLLERNTAHGHVYSYAYTYSVRLRLHEKSCGQEKLEKFGTGFFTFVERLAISFHPVWLLQRVWLLSEVPLFEG